MAISTYAFFKNVVWETYADSSGTKVAVACEYDLAKGKPDCQPNQEPELVPADRVFLVLTFLVDPQKKTFSVFDSHFESYSKRGYKSESEAYPETLYALLENLPSLGCREMLAPR